MLGKVDSSKLIVNELETSEDIENQTDVDTSNKVNPLRSVQALTFIPLYAARSSFVNPLVGFGICLAINL
jgi:hypothetical protein